MKILVISFEGIAPSVLLGNESLRNLRRLMQIGAYGLIETNERQPCSVLEHIMRAHCRRLGKSFILAAMPLSPILDQIRAMSKDRFENEIITMSRAHFASTRKLVQKGDWDYFHLVEMGIEHLLLLLQSQEGIPPGYKHLKELDESFLNDYAQHLDEEVGRIMGVLGDDTVVSVITSRDQEQTVNSGKHKLVREGAFILASANNPLIGELQAVRAIDLAATLLELGGFEPNRELNGQSILIDLPQRLGPSLTEDEESLLREQLRGLGYI